MPLYVPPAGADPADLIEQLGADIADVYNRLELRLLKQVAKKLRAGRNTWTQADRARIIAELRDYTQRLVAGLPDDLPAQVIAIAAEHGTVAAAATLGAAKHLTSPAVPVTTSMQHAVAAVQADLTNAFDRVEQRILRYPADQLGRWLGPAGDVYQRTIADTVTGPLMNAEVKESARRLAVRRFLDQGVTGFTDKAGRRWRIGTYAEMATRTAVARAYTDATVWQSQQAGINLAQVVIGHTACSHCGAWAGKTLSTDGTPAGDYQMPSMLGDGTVTVHVDGTVDEARAAGWQHPNCFPGWVPVGSPTGIRAADSRWYEGELIIIHTTEGRELSVTPNHPILTTKGWINAGSLREGDHLVSYHGDVERPTTSRPDHERIEAQIGEVFQALRQSSEVSSVLVPVTAEDFHGDGTPDTEVNVVFTHGLLGSDGKPTSLQLSPKSKLLLGGMSQRALLTEGASLEIIDRTMHPTHARMSGSRELGALSRCHLGHARIHGGGSASDIDSAVGESPSDGLAGDAVGSGDFLDALTGLISTDQIINVNRRNWSGHVYNLATGGGWYTANSIIVHNCRCFLVPYIPGGTSMATNLTRYDPDAEAARDKQRYLERRVRSFKRRAATAEDDAEATKWKRRARDEQARIRSHVAEHGLPRRSRREQLWFSDGRASA